MCYADVNLAPGLWFFKHILLPYYRVFFLFHSQIFLVPYGTTSTWAGLTTACLRSQVLSWASCLKWTLNRMNIRMLDPWSSTAGTTQQMPHVTEVETQYNDCGAPDLNVPGVVDIYCADAEVVMGPREVATRLHETCIKVGSSLKLWRVVIP